MGDQRRANAGGRDALARARPRKGAPRDPPRGSGPEGGAGTIPWRYAGPGFVLGMLVWMGALTVGIGVIPILRPFHLIPAAGAAGAVISLTRARPALWAAGGLVCAVLLAAAYTPLVVPAVRSLVREDPLQPVEAVVVLSSDIRESGDLEAASQLRLLRGYEVIRQGFGRRLVVTRLPRPKRSYVPAVSEQVRRLGLQIPVEETGVVENTRDEAVAVSRLARERGWDQVILVSEPTHMRRARAAFDRAGLRVLCAPCMPGKYDLQTLKTPGERVHAFKDWLYEVIGYQVYRARGWI